jgi:hypothetical protein
MGVGDVGVLLCRTDGTTDGGLESQASGVSHDYRICRGYSDPYWRGPQESRTGVLICTLSSSV